MACSVQGAFCIWLHLPNSRSGRSVFSLMRALGNALRRSGEFPCHRLLANVRSRLSGAERFLYGGVHRDRKLPRRYRIRRSREAVSNPREASRRRSGFMTPTSEKED